MHIFSKFFFYLYLQFKPCNRPTFFEIVAKLTAIWEDLRNSANNSHKSLYESKYKNDTVNKLTNNDISIFPKNDLFTCKDIKLSIDAKLDVYHKRNSVDVPTLITNAVSETNKIILNGSSKHCTDKKCTYIL